jgi:Icc-related predicted phosphoesterase
VIPLCPEHHRGSSGYHGMGRKAFEKRYEVTESELQQQLEELLNEKDDESTEEGG